MTPPSAFENSAMSTVHTSNASSRTSSAVRTCAAARGVINYGDHVPNFAQLKSSDAARILPGYDYDVVTAEVILTRMSMEDGRLVLPDGMSYRMLVLPDRRAISLPVLRRVHELVRDGATILGTKPKQATGLTGYPESDAEVNLTGG